MGSSLQLQADKILPRQGRVLCNETPAKKSAHSLARKTERNKLHLRDAATAGVLPSARGATGPKGAAATSPTRAALPGAFPRTVGQREPAAPTAEGLTPRKDTVPAPSKDSNSETPDSRAA